jgi:PPM family protein phosphatase
MKGVAVSALSHEGLIRDHNEDSLVVGAWTVSASAVTRAPQTLFFPGEQPVLVAVADGLGGHPAGEVASSIVVQQLARVPRLPDGEQSARALLQDCNQAVYDEAARDEERTGMGTTVAGVVVDSDANSVLVFNVGDSRVYAFDDGELTQLSVDDNPPLAPGETHTPVLTQMLGGHPGRREVETHVTVHRPGDASRYLVCTDGLSDVVPHDKIATLLAENQGQRAAYALWRAAVEGGGPDNITLAVVESVEV